MSTVTRDSPQSPFAGVVGRLDANMIAWLIFAVVAVVFLAFRDQLDWSIRYPNDWVVPIEPWLNLAMDWFTATFKAVFRFISLVLGYPMHWLEVLLHWLPWPATMAVVAIMAYAAKGWQLSAFCVVSLFYMLIIGYWDESMSTLALVGMSVPLSLALGFGMGLLAYKYRWARRIVEPLLDVMQTVPTFAYLVPILILFGVGPVVGMVASAIYASPPMVRNCMLGFSRVPDDIIESGRMSGCSEFQLMFMVRVPSALPTVMVGVNQTIMAALSMVIIAAVIGGFADIGWEVLSTMRKAQTGQSLLAGIVIVLMAMMMDRISRGFAERTGVVHAGRKGSLLHRHPYLVATAIAVVASVVLAHFITFFHDYPASWGSGLGDALAEELNRWVSAFTRNFFWLTDAIKTYTLYFFMLPMKAGLENIARSDNWGFEMTPTAAAIYWLIALMVAVGAIRKFGWRAGVVVGLLSMLFFFGSTGTPWPVFIGGVTLIAFQVGGWRVALFAFLGTLFMLVTGAWPRAMLSFYLAATSVIICFVVGGALGIWAAQSDRVSAVLRPINDTLQTMPLFVFLIPVIMVFLVGDFSALLSIIMYAIVPAIRYTEYGLRHVDPSAVEAARSMGCTERQVLWRVKMPLAIPEIMLGLNQVIMFALAMLVIAALVGTRDLGQWVYDSLTNARFGQGVIAGGSMALMAMIADRIIQAWAKQKKRDLGLVD
jgi:glycine betaine/proline transport system permease protein